MMNRPARVGLVTHVLNGGVWTVTRYLWEVLRASARYQPELIVLATSARDAASVRLLAPRTWVSGPRVLTGQVSEITYRQVGAAWTEFEFQRYRPRRTLTALLNQYDLIQVVAGAPAWAAVTRDALPPVCLFTATLIGLERAARLRQTHGWRKIWLKSMTTLNARTERQVLVRPAAVFAESDYTRQMLVNVVSPDRLHLGPPGVDTDYFKPGLQYCADGRLLAVGRWNDLRKNVRLLLTAYQRLRQRVPDAPRLALVGSHGLAPADLAYAAALGIQDHVDQVVGASPDELRTLYQGAGLFVLSSDEEGLGIVILEAMACGLPVVSTDCGGPATAVWPDENGLLTPVGDAGALAEAMQELLADPDRRRQMGRAGRALAEQRFSLKMTGQVYLDVYDRLLGC
jgi:D-inositol-3-phosphate glycosyltransferase